jgi:hypothetical protein
MRYSNREKRGHVEYGCEQVVKSLTRDTFCTRIQTKRKKDSRRRLS